LASVTTMNHALFAQPAHDSTPYYQPHCLATLNHFTLGRHPTELSGSARARTARHRPTS